VHDGVHAAIIDEALWSAVQTRLGQNAVNRKSGRNFAERSLLSGKLFDEAGQALTPSHASKGGRRYRYYVSRDLMNGDASAGGGLAASCLGN
jgi:site-specific DNA recombinase